MATRSEIKLVATVLRDGQRSDRNLRRADDGHLYTTPDQTFLSDDGPYTPPYVALPVAYDGTDDEVEEWAVQFIDELDAEIETAV